MDELNVLRLAATLEQGSEHPLAAAIVSGAAERGVQLSNAESFQSVTGKGVSGRIDGHAIALGNPALLETQASAPAILPRRPTNRGAKGRR